MLDTKHCYYNQHRPIYNWYRCELFMFTFTRKRGTMNGVIRSYMQIEKYTSSHEGEKKKIPTHHGHPCTRSTKSTNWCHDTPATIRQRLETVSALYLLTRWAEVCMSGRLFQQCLKGVIRRWQEPIFCIIRLILLYSSPTKTIRVPLLESFYFTVNDASVTIWQLHRAQTVDSIALELHTRNSIM